MKIAIVDGGGSGPNGGAGKVSGYVTDLLAKKPETVGALTGVDVNQMLKRLAEGNSAMKKEVTSESENR